MIAQGPVAGMIIEDCLPGADAADCAAGCGCDGSAELRDPSGQAFRLRTDRRCRTHVLTPADICILPNLAVLAGMGPAGLRIEAQWDAPTTVAILTRTYRDALDALRQGRPYDAPAAVERLRAATGRAMGDGALAFRRSAKALKESPHV